MAARFKKTLHLIRFLRTIDATLLYPCVGWKIGQSLRRLSSFLDPGKSLQSGQILGCLLKGMIIIPWPFFRGGSMHSVHIVRTPPSMQAILFSW